MGLINCKSCGKQVSDAAYRCPYCGDGTLQNEKTAKIFVRFFWIDVIIAALLYLFG